MAVISIITPVYKVESYIGRCIDSILNQTYNDWELILVDDGSPDKSGLICDNYAKKDSRIKVLHKKNGGVSSARNLALSKATGKYITFVDSDDWLDEDCLFKCVAEIQEGKLDMLQYGFKRVTQSGKILSRVELKSLLTDTNTYITEGCFNVCAAGSFYRHDIIKEYNIRFPETIKYAEDQIFFYNYASQTKRVKSINDCFYNYFINDQSATSNKQMSKDLAISINEIGVVGKLNSCFKVRVQKQIQIFLERILVNHDMQAEEFNMLFLKYYDPSISYLKGLVIYYHLCKINSTISYELYGRLFSLYHK